MSLKQDLRKDLVAHEEILLKFICKGKQDKPSLDLLLMKDNVEKFRMKFILELQVEIYISCSSQLILNLTSS